MTNERAQTELAERCEKATRPDRELDCLIHCAVKDWRVVYEGLNIFADMGEGMRRVLVGWLDPGKEQRNFSMTSDSLAPSYTASLDAAMTLVPKGWLPLLDSTDADAGRHYTELFPGHDVPVAKSCASTLALSLCAAALRARSQ